MYDVIKDGTVVCKINEPCYVHYIPLLKSWNVCSESESQAIWVVPYVEEGEEQQETFYARLSIHVIDENNKDFSLVELQKID